MGRNHALALVPAALVIFASSPAAAQTITGAAQVIPAPSTAWGALAATLLGTMRRRPGN